MRKYQPEIGRRSRPEETGQPVDSGYGRKGVERQQEKGTGQ